MARGKLNTSAEVAAILEGAWCDVCQNGKTTVEYAGVGKPFPYCPYCGRKSPVEVK